MNDGSKFGPPYRPPCSGWPSPRYALGTWSQHGRPNAQNITKRKNTMRVADWACSPGPDIPPYPRLRSVLPTGGTCFDFSPNVNCAVEGAACDKVFCDSWPPADRVANVWTDVGFENLSRCFKLGFKNAQAAKAWHGYFGLYSYDPSGWTYPLDLGGACSSCSFEPEHSTPDGTKYLSIAVTATYSSTLGYSGECVRNMSVGRATGVNTWDACSDSGDATGKAAARGALDGVAGWPALWRSSDLVNLFAELFYIFSGTITGTYPTEASITYNDGFGTSYEASVSLSGGTFHHKQTDDASGSYDEMNVDLTNTHCHWTLTTFRHHGMDPDVTEVTDFTADLSNTYTSGDLYGDVQTLLARIDMADDVKYQWRTDPYVSVAPLVTYDEVLSPVAPSSWHEDCDWVDANTNGPDGNPRTGAVKGDLIDAGKDTFFDFDHLTWWMCTSDIGDILWIDYKFGAPSGTPIDAWTTAGDPSDTYVQGASQWTNNQQAAWLPNGAWIGMMGSVGNFGPLGPPDQLWGWTTGVLAAQKWAEVKIPRPSVNFFRPCGADRDAIDQTTIDCATNPTGNVRWATAWPICGRRQIQSKVDVGGGVTEITLTASADYLRTADAVDFTDASGAVTEANKTVTVISATVFRFTGSIPTGTYVKSHGAPAWYWDDDNSKGDCGYATWSHNFRDYQERYRVIQQYADCADCASALPADTTPIREAQLPFMPQSVSGHTVTAECVMAVPCCPSVLFIGPDPAGSGVDDFEHAVIKTFPEAFTSDQRYGAKWQGQFFQTMQDPLFQALHRDCVDCGDGMTDSACAKTQDDGTCQESVCDPCDAGGTQYYAHADVYEWRMALPGNGGPGQNETAPALPSPLTLHVITLAEMQTGSPPDGRILLPPDNLGYTVPDVVGFPYLRVPETPWNLFLTEQSCACGGGTGEFADQYEANGAVCPI